MLLAYEEGRRLRIAVVGCGKHAYRSIFPCFDYVAVELVATCDADLARAEKYAARFGAKAACGSLAEVVARGDVEAAVLCVGPAQHPDLAWEASGRALLVTREPVAGGERDERRIEIPRRKTSRK